MSFCWTPDTLRVARRLYLDEGLSASESARRLGTTRSALIAKAHRMGWAAERDPALATANQVRGGRPAASAWRRAPPKAAAQACGAVLADGNPKPWLQRGPGECAFPVAGDGEAVVSCCAPCGAATYCAAHTSAMYIRRTQAQRQALDRIAEWVDWLEQPRPREAPGR